MGDLISRSELLKIIEDEEQGLPIDAEKYHVDKNVVDGMKASLSAIKNIVTEQPTAYDIDKVVEELRKASWEETDISTVIYIDDAIEIVKQGGVSDDVCEWKGKEKEFIQNPHTKRLYSNEPSMKNIYCITCGKKIKVVE